MKKSVLMIAYHYPPCSESTGWQRTYFFAKYLPEFDWDPIVLTVNPRVYSRTDPYWENGVLDRTNLFRVFALDSSKHLSIKGRYFKWSSVPDRWVTWWPFAVFSGLKLIKKYKPKIIWSTFPIATAHLAARSLHRLTGLPWIADFRDPMVQDGYPPDNVIRNVWWRLESKIVKEAERLVYTAPSSIKNRKLFFPEVPGNKFCVIENGYDESNFQNLPETTSSSHTKRVFLHSGLLYPKERNPIPFFNSISELYKRENDLFRDIELRFRACGYEKHYSQVIKQLGIDNIVRILPPMPQREALAEMCNACGLLLFQGNTCNYQIPAKIYEYFRTGRPILGLTEPGSDTANLLETYSNSIISPMEDANKIALAVKRFFKFNIDVESNTNENVEKFSRRERTKQLAIVLENFV